MKITRRELTVKNAKSFLKITGSVVGSERVQTVDARTLWKWLGVGRDFSNWVKSRIEEGQFEENKDYVVVAKNGEVKNQRVTTHVGDPIEYHVTLDMAKHLAMLERNDKGRQAREYFIKCEKDLIVIKKKVQTLKQQIFSLENEPLTLQGFQQLSLKDRKKQRSQIWEIWRKTHATSRALNYRRIQVANF